MRSLLTDVLHAAVHVSNIELMDCASKFALEHKLNLCVGLHTVRRARFLIGTKRVKEHLNNPEAHKEQSYAKERLEDRVEAISEHSK